LLIAAGVFWFLRPGRSPQTEPQRQRHLRKAGGTQEEPRQDGAFCHQCGKRAAVGDIFCRACGTKLR
ncbi:MAG: zinc ribbon domain-containing protein, partial [Anaerolineaceae bacterium]|nr:zinc ribbon domain-containing protein [Anaerolineaceae bacterium]